MVALLTTVLPCLRLQKFAQSLLEVADNLESAQRAVPATVLQPGAEISTETALGYLKALLEGVQATERVLLKVSGACGQALALAFGEQQDETRLGSCSCPSHWQQ
jgi:hypothetical protein